MPRYFLHARHGNGFSFDPVGVELVSPDPIEEMIHAQLAANGMKLVAELVVEVMDAQGEVVKIIRIGDV